MAEGESAATGGLLVALGIVIALGIGLVLYKGDFIGHDSSPDIKIEMPKVEAPAIPNPVEKTE